MVRETGEDRESTEQGHGEGSGSSSRTRAREGVGRRSTDTVWKCCKKMKHESSGGRGWVSA